jgi:hypothetical protein
MTVLAKHGGTAFGGKRPSSVDITFDPIDYSGLKIAAYVSTGSHIDMDSEGKNETGSPILHPRASFLELLGPESDLHYSQGQNMALKYITTLRQQLVNASAPYGGIHIVGTIETVKKDGRDVLPSSSHPTVVDMGAVKFADLNNAGLAAISDNERMQLMAQLFEQAHEATVKHLGERIEVPSRWSMKGQPQSWGVAQG